MREIDLHVGGCVTGMPVAVNRTAAVGGDGRGEMRIEVPTVPLRWDPAFLLPMIWEGLALTRPVDDLPAYFEARQVVYDEQRREIGSAVLVAEVVRDGEKISCRGQFVDARYRLELGERVVAVDERRSGEVVELGEDGGAVVCTWGMRTLRGNRYWAVTTTVVDGEQIDSGGLVEGRREGAVELEIESVGGGVVRVVATGP